MVKLPRIPQAWEDQSAGTPQETLPARLDLNAMPEGILDGWQPPGWSPAGSGLAFLLHPQTIAQIDFGDRQGPHAVQAMAGQSAGNLAAGSAMGDGQRQVQAVDVKPGPIDPGNRAGQASQQLENSDTSDEASEARYAPNGVESVVVNGSRPRSDGAKWEAKAYFTNPYQVGGAAQPKNAVHGGIKIYRNGKFVYSIDAGPQLDHVLEKGTLGNLIFNRAPDSVSVNERSVLADKGDSGEVTLVPPPGVSSEDFAQALMMAAKSYDDTLPYSLPPLATFDYAASDVSNPLAGGALLKMPYGVQNSLAPRTYNSNSFLAGLLTNVGAGSNIELIKQYIGRKNRAAPGIENPVPRDRFRNW
ncbi:MAG TPA: hypothetical protein VJQ06_09365 [Rhizomicrobium sp.]|nr:hypothetical protein [Rhizomicrobium sp.]